MPEVRFTKMWELPTDVQPLIGKGWVAVVTGTTVLAVFPDRKTAEDYAERDRDSGGYAWLVPQQ